jgi:hypothetical protein
MIEMDQRKEKNIGRAATASARMSGSWTSYLGAAHGVLTAAGMTDLDLAETAGMTGLAFHLVMHKQCDAAAVTVYDWPNRHQDALDRIGILAELYHYEPHWRTYEAARRRAKDNIQASIDRGIGVIAWAIDTGEFGVIYGYDDEDGVYLVDGVDKFNRPLGSDPLLYENIAKPFPPAPFLHYQIPLERTSYDPERTYLESFKFYVHEMEKPFHMSADFYSGFLAYDCWIRALKEGAYRPFGLRYCLTVYAESKMFAAEYARKLAKTWGGLPGLNDAAGLFEEIAGQYSMMMKEVLEQDFDGAKHLGKPVPAAQALKLVSFLEKAKHLEEQAVRIFKNA